MWLIKKKKIPKIYKKLINMISQICGVKFP